ncbi:hypothetical protein NHX12_007491 [Muraenolepis orangiensis]|uniref:Uncharacterized protein n=1 Tax=Muraenolepis orangiensis TaxID=630683 RepID=A0A9Q0DPY6_9TELE|nr:hypothetical protein NHX12_007491 [Muraenolepis orangiensis]
MDERCRERSKGPTDGADGRGSWRRGRFDVLLEDGLEARCERFDVPLGDGLEARCERFDVPLGDGLEARCVRATAASWPRGPVVAWCCGVPGTTVAAQAVPFPSFSTVWSCEVIISVFSRSNFNKVDLANTMSLSSVQLRGSNTRSPQHNGMALYQIT